MTNIDAFILKDDYLIKRVPNYTQNLLELTDSNYNHYLIMPIILTVPELYRLMIETLFKSIEMDLKEGNELHPIIFISSISWLDSFYGSVEMQWNERVQRFIDKNAYISFLFNSSSWIQFVELEFSSEDFNQEESRKNYTNAIEHFDRLNLFKIFDNPNAKEYIEYHFRLQQNNYLYDKSISYKSSGHGRHISPNIYSNEQKLREEIVISKDLEFLFTKRINHDTNDFKVKGVTLRILLVDDKIGNQSECKAKLIKDLLELKFEPRIKGKKSIRSGVCWLTPINEEDTVKIFQLQSQCITCSILNECGIRTGYELDSLSQALNEIKNKDCIQIIPVKSLELARQLLKDYRFSFDLIMMDYLLDKKTDNDGKKTDEREYATDFWGDGNEKYFELTSKESIEKKYEGEGNDKIREKYLELKEIYGLIKQNRGPMKRLWIFPITAFNQTFIDDLRNKGVRLIDYYWYLSRGADPINTPYLFISSLNQFLQLQLENALFSKEEITGFVRKTIETIEDVNDLDDYNAFMGAEYTIFVERYMTRAVASRDRKVGSLFANYVWNNFYKITDNKSLFILVQKIEKFYHCCAFGTEADTDKMIFLHRELKTYLMENFRNSFEVSEIDKFYCKIVMIKSKL
jgi:hypothetical protein